MTDLEKDLRIQELTKQLAISDRALVNLRLGGLETAQKDHEGRIRALTATATQFKTMVSLSLGGGMLSAAGLVKLIFFP
jgi:hypothetical protein